jgi:hypothetical protein
MVRKQTIKGKNLLVCMKLSCHCVLLQDWFFSSFAEQLPINQNNQLLMGQPPRLVAGQMEGSVV